MASMKIDPKNRYEPLFEFEFQSWTMQCHKATCHNTSCPLADNNPKSKIIFTLSSIILDFGNFGHIFFITLTNWHCNCNNSTSYFVFKKIHEIRLEEYLWRSCCIVLRTIEPPTGLEQMTENRRKLLVIQDEETQTTQSNQILMNCATALLNYA